MTVETTSQRNKRIAKNTLLLYVRMIISMGVSLYSVRIVLNTLGVEDYGLYNVVGGVVALLSFLPGSMASATQRFFSHALGEDNQEKLNRIFGVNSFIYLGIGVLAFLILNTGGVWFVENQLEVPEGRLDALVSLFYIAVITFVISIIKSPMMAIIIAHEDMKIYAYMAILEALLKLGVVFLLIYIPGDKIIIYGFLLMGVSIIDTTVYSIICFNKYIECRFKNIRWDYMLAKQIIGFTGWTLFGQLTTVARGAALTILLNQYFTPVVVAARAIAVNIAGQSNLLAAQFNTSLYSPIIKSFAANKKKEMYDLVIIGSKATFFLMWILALPIFIEMKNILGIWLKNTPIHTVEFARLTLVEGLIFAISLPLTTAARAPGKMAAYETILGILQFSILIISWLLLIAGWGPKTVFYVAIAVNMVMFFVRLIIVSSLTGLPVKGYLKGTIPEILYVIFVSASLSFLVAYLLPEGFVFFALTVITTVVVTAIAIFFLGLPIPVRIKLLDFINYKIGKLTKRI
ncbi:oligosaccharide flippase family protein [Cyclobacterium sp. 1_MG-2023]|uniref:oligosaccharide flippase family protein n=1 Tax=Cyclobacterium sp. 1_MG-2023 TaxID=3062681 RepID=UPI0026E34A3A|nr:oligosaccharide flippase family protein [Cyclobacterium sp. 1_MG-2023]MDO6440390.1 oligosaccharide flippase family protein [Cyclobacterium sp. 1_MG-2023]